eukprot:TRINITY_DN1250_c0_g5_i4.p1 TRINITY_DN1250_c0_g5~~TRINITY_DN1250_c0_g5_i4.p1  ORF type:complete len:293 (-),score=29.03 TRINITY_DN1250_c0_g5_i4:25-903(-)
MSSVCPFAKAARPGEVCQRKMGENHERDQSRHTDNEVKKEGDESAVVSPKCPFGYDSHTFKLGPLSCVICQALLFESSKCVPCSHKFCKACISRFRDCPLCGADIDKIEPDNDLQEVVDHFIEGHGRIKRSQINVDPKEVGDERKNVAYEDVSLERGSFLVQQAMRAFRAQNIGSAKSRLVICADDIREQLERFGSTSELCSQLGAVTGPRKLSVSLCSLVRSMWHLYKHFLSNKFRFLYTNSQQNSDMCNNKATHVTRLLFSQQLYLNVDALYVPLSLLGIIYTCLSSLLA